MPGRPAGRPRPAFTLLELLVVMSTITVLLSLLLPALSRLRQGAKAVQCMANLRVVAFDFQLFANDSFSEDRGGSAGLAAGLFRFEDFVEREYRVAEFWEGAARTRQQLKSRADHMMCPSISEPLYRVPDIPCSSGAVQPYSSVGYSFNARLHIQTMMFVGRPWPDRNTLVRSEVLNKPTIPVAFDVDGERAAQLGRAPYFTAPPVAGHDDIYADGSMWFPSTVHSGRMNVVFTGGYIRATEQAAAENGWDWKYQPKPIE